jgi:PST family polysaccharide transporter
LINVGFVFFPSWFFQGLEKLSKVALFNFITKALFATFVILLLKQRSDFLFYTLSLSISQITVGVLAFFYGLRYYKIKLIRISNKEIIYEFKTGLSVFLSNIAVSLYTTTNLIILGFYETETEYGYFSAALKIATITHSLIVLPLGLTLFPHIGVAMAHSKRDGLMMLMKYIKWISISTFLLGAFIFVFAGDLISILFGHQFLPGVIYLRIMAFMPFVSGLNNLVSVQGLLNLKKDKEYLFITLATFVFSLVLNVILVSKYRSFGTAIIQLTCEVFMVIVATFYVYKIKSDFIEA